MKRGKNMKAISKIFIIAAFLLALPIIIPIFIVMLGWTMLMKIVEVYT